MVQYPYKNDPPHNKTSPTKMASQKLFDQNLSIKTWEIK